MEALLTVIGIWLSVNFGLPAAEEPPFLERASPTQMAEVRESRLAALRLEKVSAEDRRPSRAGEGVFAIYDDVSRTIYLGNDWNTASPADTSVLVHEMVHHLQNAAGMKFACPGEREKDAYRAQRAWLELFDRTLEAEFQLDPMTILVRTNCLR